MEKPKVVLVAGSPRGGTTISNMLLGQHPAIFPTGSLQGFPDAGEIFDESNICSCGELARECPFWSGVRERYLPLQQLPDAEKLPHLFGMIAEHSGRTFVADMTHNMTYATELLGITGIDVYLVHVIRDGRGVVHSRLRRDYRVGRLKSFGWRHVKRVIGVSRHWRKHVEQFAQLERQLGPKAVRVSYEALCADPASALRPVGECLGLDFDAVGTQLGESRQMQRAPHLLRGNPLLRRSDEIVLRYDDRFRREMSRLDRAVFALASRWRW